MSKICLRLEKTESQTSSRESREQTQFIPESLKGSGIEETKHPGSQFEEKDLN